MWPFSKKPRQPGSARDPWPRLTIGERSRRDPYGRVFAEDHDVGLAFEVVATVTSLEPGIQPEYIVFKGVDLTNLRGCESPITLRTDDGEQYHGLTDLRQHEVHERERVVATIRAVRVPGLGPMWIVPAIKRQGT